jgi:hypothetical protein
VLKLAGLLLLNKVTSSYSEQIYTVKSFPSSAGMSLTKLFPARWSLVSDIPAGDGKIANLFTVYPSSSRKSQLPSKPVLLKIIKILALLVGTNQKDDYKTLVHPGTVAISNKCK